MFARTARLTLRPGWPEDASALFDAIAHEATATRVARVPWPYALDDAHAWLHQPASSDYHRLLMFAHDRGALPALVGAIGLRCNGERGELGYWLTPTAWNRGYATEAGRQMVAIARDALRLRRLAAYHHLDNPASGQVLRKLGFREAGRAVRPSLGRGHAVESALFTLDLDEDDRPVMSLAA